MFNKFFRCFAFESYGEVLRLYNNSFCGQRYQKGWTPLVDTIILYTQNWIKKLFYVSSTGGGVGNASNFEANTEEGSDTTEN